MAETRRSSSSSKRPLSSSPVTSSNPTSSKRSKASEPASCPTDGVLVPEPIKEFGSDSPVTEIRSSDLRVSDVAKADDGSVPDKSADADVENGTLVSPDSLANEAVVDAEKAEGLSGRVKKKPAKSASKVPWGKLLSQHSQDCVILGADTRATEGPIVCDKNCEKIHYMAPNIYCCGAGTIADTKAVTDMVSSQLQLHRYHTGRESRVVTALTLLKRHLFNYQGYVSAALVLGGVDVTRPHLHWPTFIFVQTLCQNNHIRVFAT
ncbi:hypothetical protein V6N13_148847 [Hibiscus sabdariffa]|uniref:Proteasome endopeptidase complex n=1 Tax=Hibiscus sabdariffa TaxID=183260 RepID=A0ABR2EJ41_9ROSI